MSLLYRYMTLILIIVVAGIFQASADHLRDNSAFQSIKNLPLYPGNLLFHHLYNSIGNGIIIADLLTNI